MEKILIIDDDNAVRKLVRHELSDTYDVVDSGDPDQGLALALEHRPNAILVDLRMPKYSGYELAQTYSNFAQTQDVPIIIVSGEGGRLTPTQVAHLGAVAVFDKPIDFDALRACLAKQIRRQGHLSRPEVRVRLNVLLTIKGHNRAGQSIEDSVTTEQVSVNGFACNSDADFHPQSTIEVYLSNCDHLYVGKAKILQAENQGKTHHYECKFLVPPREWLLR